MLSIIIIIIIWSHLLMNLHQSLSLKTNLWRSLYIDSVLWEHFATLHGKGIVDRWD